jgi:diguanylate cyclase (GGDEF)-like protein
MSNWLAVADIDHFKQVNDTYGHIIGDEVLLLVAQLMRQSFRLGDQLFRFGGEEFVTVLQPVTQDDAQMVLDRFRHNLKNYEFPIVGRVTISIGFTQIHPIDTPTELVGRADQALYFAKQNGRDRVVSYEFLRATGELADQQVDKPKVELF